MDFDSGSTSYPQLDTSAQQPQYPTGTDSTPQDPGRKMLYVAPCATRRADPTYHPSVTWSSYKTVQGAKAATSPPPPGILKRSVTTSTSQGGSRIETIYASASSLIGTILLKTTPTSQRTLASPLIYRKSIVTSQACTHREVVMARRRLLLRLRRLSTWPGDRTQARWWCSSRMRLRTA